MKIATPKTVLCTVAFILLFAVVTGYNQNMNICDNPQLSDATELSYCLYDTYHFALTNYTPNLYAMRKAFYYARTNDPVLYQVNYTIAYSDNIDLLHLPKCPVQKEDRTPHLNHTNQTTHIYGWTSNGVYTIIHPLLLNAMQFQSLLFMEKVYDNFSIAIEGPYVGSFLWDGLNDLPNIHLKLIVNSLPCVPSQGQIDTKLKEITTLLKTYEGIYFEGTQSHTKENLAFALESESTIVSNNILSYRKSGTIYGCYIAYMIAAGIILIAVLCVTICREDNKTITNIHKPIYDRRPLYPSTVVVSTFILLLLGLVDLAAVVFWIVILHDNAKITAAVVFLHAIPFMEKLAIFVITVCTQCIHGTCSWGYPAIIVIFTGASILLNHSFPTLVFILVYPIDIAASLTYAVACYFSLNIAIAVGIKSMYSPCETNTCVGLCLIGVGLITLVFILFFMFFLHLFGQWLIYLLAIGKTAVVSIGPLTIISLLPSFGIAVITWIVKEKVLNRNTERSYETIN